MTFICRHAITMSRVNDILGWVSSSSSSHLWKMYLKINFWTIKQILFFSIFLTISCILELILFFGFGFDNFQTGEAGDAENSLNEICTRCWKNQKKEGLKKLPKEWRVKKVKKAEKCENEWLKRKREMDQINNAILWIQLGNNILRVKSFFFSVCRVRTTLFFRIQDFQKK